MQGICSLEIMLRIIGCMLFVIYIVIRLDLLCFALICELYVGYLLKLLSFRCFLLYIYYWGWRLLIWVITLPFRGIFAMLM